MKTRRWMVTLTLALATLGLGCMVGTEPNAEVGVLASWTCDSGYGSCKKSCEATYPKDETRRKQCERECKTQYCTLTCEEGEVVQDGKCVEDPGTGSPDPVVTEPVSTEPAAPDPVVTDPVTDAPCGAGECGGGVPSERLIFVTKATFMGDLGQVVGADAKCQAAATAANKRGVYKAWLSQKYWIENDVVNYLDPIHRMEHAAVPYRLPNGRVVANNWADLVDGTLAHPINITEDGTPSTGGTAEYGWQTTTGAPYVWTWTLPNGSSPYIDAWGGENCSQWQATGAGLTGQCEFGGVGDTRASNIDWTNIGTAGPFEGLRLCCTSRLPIYCVEQQ